MDIPDLDSTTRGHVVVGVDGSEYSDEALDWAAEQAWLERRPLLVLHAEEPLTPNQRMWLANAGIPPNQVETEADDASRAVATRAVDRARKHYPALEIESQHVVADPRDALLAAARDATTVVVGSRGRGPMRSLLLGSVSVAVARYTHCQVAVIRPRVHGTVRRGVLVGTDGTAKSLPTIEVAYRQASMRGLPLTVAHCAWDFEAASVDWRIVREDPGLTDLRVTVAETLAGMQEKFPDVQVEVLIARGRADSFLVDQGATMDLVVVGRHDRSVLDRWGLGSVATSVIEGTKSVVLVVP